MNKLLKMDLRQLFHRKTLYLMIIVLSALTLSMLCLSDPATVTIESVLGVMNGVSMDNFMSAANGLGLIYTLVCIMLSFFVCDDFSSGFAKNIFTVHAGKFDYISSKIVSMMVGSAVLMFVSLVESLVYCGISGVAIGSVGSVVLFWLQKWILTAPFAAAILFISLWVRNKGLGFLFACLLGTGGLVMGLAWGFEALHIPFSSQILSFTMYGASTVPPLQFHAGDLLHVLLTGVVWTVVYSVLSAVMLKKKDV